MQHTIDLGPADMEGSSRTPTELRHRKRRDHRIIVCSVLVVLAAALAYAARDVFTESAEKTVEVAKPQAASEPEAPKAAEPADDLVDDDGETLWVSPTDGKPLDLAYLPPGVEIVLALRPESIASHSEGEKVFDSIMPVARPGIKILEALFPGVHGVTDTVIGWSRTGNGEWQFTIVAHLNDKRTAADYLASKFPNASRKGHADKTYSLVGEQAYFVPDDKDGRTLVVSNVNAMLEVLELEGQPPPLTRDMERLLEHTDANRTATLLFRPATLLSDADDVLQGSMAPLRLPLEMLLGDDIGAAALSMNWGDDFFVEVIAVPTLDSSPEQLSDKLAKRVDELPDAVEEFVLGVDASQYSRRVVARLPEMTRTLAAYTRHGFDRDAAVLRCYLPVVAGHNLIMGAELALAEGQGVRSGGARARTSPLAEASSPGSIEERLKKMTSLRFAREELEAALNIFGEDVGVEIEILGPDLQLDGITRNQLFGIDMANRRADEILVEILRRANPDKLATGPADPRQKLVFVVRPDAVVITTRAAAAKRGEPLPTVFRAGE